MEVEEKSLKEEKINKQKGNDGGKNKNFRKKTIRHQHKLILNEEDAASEVPSSFYFPGKTKRKR